ncbi:MAG: antitoxin family protein [Candidatus Magnetobacterium sp. LHC-1]|nr:antitoxin family protein [Nitrospirota bacterium]
MQTMIKARFSDGVFEPLNEVDLPEGKEIDIVFEDNNTEDDAYWIERAMQAEKNGYIGHERSLVFIIERLV